jgi:hypothetical protein
LCPARAALKLFYVRSGAIGWFRSRRLAVALVALLPSCIDHRSGVKPSARGSETAKATDAGDVMAGMFARYAGARSYTDEGQATMIVHLERGPDTTSRMGFETAFERETNGFSFVTRPGDRATKLRIGRGGVIAIWQPVRGEAKSWWSAQPAVRSSSVRDATVLYNFHTGGVSARVPSLLLGHPGQLATRKFQVLGDEVVGGVPCVLVGTSTNPPVKYWIAKSDYSLRRAWGRWRVASVPPYELEVQVDYVPKFDERLAPARFVFAPPVVEPLRDSCVDRGVASDGSEPLIDDLEDGDLAIRKVDQRLGRWWRYGDDDCDVKDWGPPEAPGGANPSRYAMHVSAKNCGSWGFGVGFGLNEVNGHCAYDAGTYDGIAFWARTGGTDETVSFIVRTRQTVPLEFGGDGSCQAGPEKHCWDGFATNVQVTPEWHAYSFKWAELGQAGFGNPATFDAKQIVALMWQTPTRADGSTTELWLDQVSFFKGTPPASPLP